MALLWIEGFESFNTVTDTNISADLALKYPINGGLGADNQLICPGRTGGCAYRVRQGAPNIQIPSFTKQATLVTGLGVKFDFNPTSSIAFWIMRNQTGTGSPSNEMTVSLDANFRLKVFRGASVLLGTSANNVLTLGVWHYLEFKAFHNNTTGSFELRVDGVNVLSDTNVDTLANDFPDSVLLTGAGGSVNSNYDDWYVLDTTGGAPNNDFLGNVKVVGMVPNAVGDSSVWTPSAGSNFQNMDDIPQDGDTTFNEASVVGDKDLYNLTDPSGLGGTIHGIQINTILRTTDASNFNVSNVVKSGVTEQDQATNLIASTSYQTIYDRLETDPNTSAAWLAAALTALQTGVKIQA